MRSYGIYISTAPLTGYSYMSPSLVRQFPCSLLLLLFLKVHTILLRYGVRDGVVLGRFLFITHSVRLDLTNILHDDHT